MCQREEGVPDVVLRTAVLVTAGELLSEISSVQKVLVLIYDIRLCGGQVPPRYNLRPDQGLATSVPLLGLAFSGII